MWLHYLKTAWRSLLADRFFSLVNLFGLSVGLAAVALILLYVRHEYSYDRWLPGHESLYRIDTVETAPGQDSVEIAAAPGPIRQALLKDFPQIADIARAYMARTSLIREAEPFTEDVLVADPNFFSLVGLPFVHGDAARALDGTGSVALSERAAAKYFGGTDPIGRRITILTPMKRDFTVSAVFRNIPANSHMAFDIAIGFDAYFRANSEEIMAVPENWGGAYFHTYARLKPGAKAEDVERALPAFIDRHLPSWITDAIKAPAHIFYRFRLVPVRDLHFDGAVIGAMKPPASRAAVFGVSSIALLILLIASINFANLTTARSLLRAREVALRKVVGANRRQIFIQFFGEALFLTACAGLVALAAVELVMPFVGRLLGLAGDVLKADPALVWLAMLALILATAAGSGVYPAFILSRIKPALALSRDYARRKGVRLRSLLVLLQFAVSIALIAITVTMVMQTRYARSADLGFDKDDVLVVRLPEQEGSDQMTRAFADAAARNPDVASAALSSAVPSDVSEDNISLRLPGQAKPVQLGYHRIDSRFFETLRVRPFAGRTSTMRQESAAAGDGEAEEVPVIVNRSALRSMGFREPSDAVGIVVRSAKTAFTIVGVVPDLHFRSLHEPVRAELYAVDDEAGNIVSIRYRTDDIPALLSFVDTLWQERMPNQAIERHFLDDALDALYEKERNQAVLLTLFSGIAIILSCLGLIAMAAFSLQRRTREIALRKLMGANRNDIARLLLWEYGRPVLLANLIAWPAAWLVLRHWLNGFAYRIDMPVSAFILAGASAILIALLAVGFHTGRVAGASPIFALRYE